MAFIHLVEITIIIQGICNRITYQYDKFIDFYKKIYQLFLFLIHNVNFYST